MEHELEWNDNHNTSTPLSTKGFSFEVRNMKNELDKMKFHNKVRVGFSVENSQFEGK